MVQLLFESGALGSSHWCAGRPSLWAATALTNVRCGGVQDNSYCCRQMAARFGLYSRSNDAAGKSRQGGSRVPDGKPIKRCRVCPTRRPVMRKSVRATSRSLPRARLASPEPCVISRILRALSLASVEVLRIS